MVLTLYRRKAGSAAFVAQPRIAPASGRYYGFRESYGGVTTTAAMAASNLYAMPFFVASALTANLLSCNITTAAAAGKKIRMGIYAATAAGLPGALLVDSGEIAADPGAPPALTPSSAISVALVAGQLYFLAIFSDGGPTLTATTATRSLFGETDPSTVIQGGLVRSLAYAALPDPFGTPSGYITNQYNVLVRAA